MRHRPVPGLIAIALLLCLGASQAWSHSALLRSSPADKQTVASVEELKLAFNEEVRLVRLVVKDAAERELDIAFRPVTDVSREFAVPLPALDAGAYSITWTLIGRDGHTVSESFVFTVDPTAADESAHAGHGDHHH